MRLLSYLQILPSLGSLGLFTASVLYCWVAETTPFFEAAPKSVDAQAFLLCVGLVVLFSLRSWRTTTKPDQSNLLGEKRNLLPLPREQTEEWKGWMQAVILLYHYFGLSENLRVYQVIRVLVAAYVFLTGYGHTTYFLNTNDFSKRRAAAILLRLNLLSSLLAYTMNRTWDFYYFPGLTSFWFLVIHTTLHCVRTISGGLHWRPVLTGLCVSCALVQCSLYSEAGKSTWNALLTLIKIIGGAHIRPEEFTFRLKLDSFMPYWGALAAVITAENTGQYGQYSNCSFLVRLVFQRSTAVYTSWIASSILILYFFAIQEFKDKVRSNFWHPFHSIIPIMAMLIIRNATPSQRHGYNGNFQWLGVCSLEAYVLQSHIWLTNRNKSLLHVNIIDRQLANSTRPVLALAHWLENVTLAVIFLITSHSTARATKPIVDWLMVDATRRLTVMLLVYWMLNLHWVRMGLSD